MVGADAALMLLLALPFGASLAAAFLRPHARNLAATLGTAAMAASLAIVIGLSPPILRGESLGCQPRS